MSLDERPRSSKLAEEESAAWNKILEIILESSCVKCVPHTPDCTENGKIWTLIIVHIGGGHSKVIKISLALSIKTCGITFIFLHHIRIHEKISHLKSTRALSRSLK